jgi:hypothetical protein
LVNRPPVLPTRQALAIDHQIVAAVADQGGGQIGPVDVQLDQPGVLSSQVSTDRVGDAGFGCVGWGDPHCGDQSGVQVPADVAFVAVDQDGAGLAAVAHIGVFHADPPVFGHPPAQLGGGVLGGGCYVLLAHLMRYGQALLGGLGLGLGGHERLYRVQRGQHLDQGLVPGGGVIPVQVQGRFQA